MLAARVTAGITEETTASRGGPAGTRHSLDPLRLLTPRPTTTWHLDLRRSEAANAPRRYFRAVGRRRRVRQTLCHICTSDIAVAGDNQYRLSADIVPP